MGEAEKYFRSFRQGRSVGSMVQGSQLSPQTIAQPPIQQPKPAPVAAQYKQMPNQNSLPDTPVPQNLTPIQMILKKYSDVRFGPEEYASLYKLVDRESGFNPKAKNPKSTAAGLFQFLDMTSKNYGLPIDASQAPVEKQIEAGLKYIKDRYGSPSKALQFHYKNNFY